MSESELNALGRYLRILGAAPEPHLARGRERVLAEAELLTKHELLAREPIGAHQIGYGFALAALALVLGMGLVALTAPGWSLVAPGNPFSSFFSAPVLAHTAAPAAGITETTLSAATPDSNPSPRKMEMALTVVPTNAPGPLPITEPTPSPLLTLTRSAQILSKY